MNTADNTVSEMYSDELYPYRTTYPAYTFTSIDNKHSYIFSPKKDALLLHIKANIYALQESKETPLELTRSYLPLTFKVDVMTPENYKHFYPYIKDAIADIAESLETENALSGILQRQVESIIIMLLSINLSIIKTVMQSISGIALTNIMPLGKQPFELAMCIYGRKIPRLTVTPSYFKPIAHSINILKFRENRMNMYMNTMSCLRKFTTASANLP